MIRIFIIDDETPIRQWLRFCIERSDSCFEIAGESANGEDGLKALAKTEADIVILDIMMPGINGLEVLSQLNAMKPGLSIIMLTNFAEFKYIQKAVRSGAVEYFLKSEITEEGLMDCLQKIASAMKQNSMKLQLSSELELQTVRSLCEQILNHTIDSQEQFLKSAEAYPHPMSFKNNLFVIAIRCRPGTFANFTGAALADISEYLSTMHQIAWNGHDCFLVCEMNKLNSQLMIFNSIAGMLRWICTNIPHAYIGVSNIYHDFSSLYHGMTESLLSLNTGFYKKPGSVTFISEAKEKAIDQDRLSVFSDEILNIAKTGTQDELRLKLLSVFDYFRTSMPSDLSFVNHYFLELLYLIHSVFMSNTQQFRFFDQAVRRDIHQGLPQAIFLDELQHTVMDLLPRFYSKESLPAFSAPIADATAYIKEHYCENITLKDVADAIHMNADYLGKLFKKETGCSFNTYLTNIKMEYADYLIRNTNLKKYEIAEKLGYTNFSYFSRIYSAHKGR